MSRTTMQFVMALDFATRNSPEASRHAWEDCSPTHRPNNNAHATAVKAEKVIFASGTNEEWTYFTQGRAEYKRATHPVGEDIIFQLLECCDEAVRKYLTKSFNNPTSYGETTLLGHKESFAVRQENVMVARLHLQQMRQDRNEPARNFSARLKGQASVCQYNIDCNCGSQFSHGDQMVRDTLIVGLADDDIRLDVLGQANQEMSLDETISGKRSAGRVHHNPPTVPTAINAASSTYKRNERRRF